MSGQIKEKRRRRQRTNSFSFQTNWTLCIRFLLNLLRTRTETRTYFKTVAIPMDDLLSYYKVELLTDALSTKEGLL